MLTLLAHFGALICSLVQSLTPKRMGKLLMTMNLTSCLNITEKVPFFLNEMRYISEKSRNQCNEKDIRLPKTGLQATLTPTRSNPLISRQSNMMNVIFLCILNPKLVKFDTETREKLSKTFYRLTSKLIKPSDTNL